MRHWVRALGPFAANCYIIACPETLAAAIVDPGQPDPWIRRVVAENGLQVTGIWLTHGHVDHIGGVEWALSWTGAPLLAPGAEAELLADPVLNGSTFAPPECAILRADRWLRHGDTLQLGRLTFQVIHTPGHTPGGVCFYTPGHLISGDTLFAGGVGRTDLPGGDEGLLLGSIRKRLYILPGDTRVYPGHGPATTIGDEREYNPFT